MRILVSIILIASIFLAAGCVSTSKQKYPVQIQNNIGETYAGQTNDSIPHKIILSLYDLKKEGALDYLINVLENPDTKEKVRRVTAVALSRHVRDYPQLKKPLETILKGKDTQLKKDIILGLGQSKGKVAFDMIKPFVQDEEPLLRQASVLSLAYSDIPEAIDIIKPLADDPIPEVRQVTAFSLGIKQDLSALDSVKKLAKDEIPEVRATALGSLTYMPVEIGSEQLRVVEVQPFLDDPSPMVRVVAAEILVPEVANFSELESKFIKLAEFDDDIMVKSVATLGLGNINKPEIVDIVKINLKSPYPYLRQAAAISLGDIDLDTTVKPLKSALKDANYLVRGAAIRGLGNKIAKFPKIANNIKPFLKDKSWEVRKVTVDSIGKLDTPSIDKLIAPAIQDDNIFVRRAAITNLGPRVSKEPYLIKHFIKVVERDSDAWNRQIAALSLGSVQSPYIESARDLIQNNLPTSNIKVVVIIPGVDDIFDFRGITYRDMTADWSENIRLRKVLEANDIKVMEHEWTGNYKDIPGAQMSLDHTITAALDFAGANGKVLTVMYSAGNWVGERFFSSNLDQSIKFAFKEDRLDLISFAPFSKYDFGKIDSDWKNYGGALDIVTLPSTVYTGFRGYRCYNYFPDIVKDLPEAHAIYKDTRVISEILEKCTFNDSEISVGNTWKAGTAYLGPEAIGSATYVDTNYIPVAKMQEFKNIEIPQIETIDIPDMKWDKER